MRIRLATLLFLVTIAVSPVARSQTPDTLKAPTTHDQFPIGVIVQGEALDSLWRMDSLTKMLGINSYYEGWYSVGDAALFPREGQPFDTTVAFKDPFYWNTANNVTYNHNLSKDSNYHGSLLNMLKEAAYSKDVRCYLPGTSGNTAEYSFPWKVKLGGNDTLYHLPPPIGTGSPNEWFIPDTAVSAAGYVLKLCNGSDSGVGATSPYFSGKEYSGPESNTNHIGSVSYDFVFALTGQSSTSGPLYKVEYVSVGNGDNTVLAADIISATSYSSLPSAQTQTPYRTVKAEDFRTWPGQSNANKYRLLHREIPASTIRSLYANNFQSPPIIDVRIYSYAVSGVGIYPRVLRIRNWIGQQLLSGRCDSILTKAAQRLATVNNNEQAKSWSFMRENPVYTFHSFSYIHNLLCDSSLPAANALQAGSYDELVRVFRDQCETKNVNKGQLWYEASLFGGVGYRLHDKIDWRAPALDYETFGVTNDNYWSPVPKAIMPDSIDAFHHGIHVLGDYSTYTRNYQDSIIGYASEHLGGGFGWARTMTEQARSCYGLEPPIPMRMSPQLLGGHMLMPKWKMDSIQWLLLQYIKSNDTGHFYSTAITPLLPYYSSSVCSTFVNYWRDMAFSTSGGSSSERADLWSHHVEDSLSDAVIFRPYFARHGTDTIFAVDSILDWFWLGDRMPTTTEASFQLWWGITHGLKGYLINYGGDDGISQHGIMQTDLRKSQDEPGIWEGYCCLKTHVGWFGQDNQVGNEVFTQFNWYDQQPYDGSIPRYLPLPKGFKPLFNEVQREMRDDLDTLASLLSQLTWKGSVSWHKRDSTPTYLSRLPVKNVTSKNLSNSSDSTAYVDFGTHQLPSDDPALYLSVLNRRLWTDSLGTDQTDTRTITMSVHDSAFNSFYYAWPQWSVRNMATGWDTVIALGGSFSIKLGAGRGVLFRIAPDMSTITGTMSTNRMNNARHSAFDETSAIPTHVYYDVYGKKGNIMLASPLEAVEGTSKRKPGTPQDSLIDGSGLAHNPAIAFNPFQSQGMGIVYSVDKAGTSHDSTFIIYRHSNARSPYQFNVRDTLDRFKVTDAKFMATPAISPARWVNYPVFGSFYTYWVSWRHPVRGAAITQVDTFGNFKPIRYFSAGDSLSTKFVSISSRVDSGRKIVCHIAFQEDTMGNPAVFYCQATLDSSNPNNIKVDSLLNISKGLRWCGHITPSITMNVNEAIYVTWESVDMWSEEDLILRKHYAVNRFRDVSSGWSDFQAFNAYTGFPRVGTMPADSLRLLPVNLLADTLLWGTGGSSDVWRLDWNHNMDNHLRMANAFITIEPKFPWFAGHIPIERLTEFSLEPSLPVRTRGSLPILEPIDFRSPVMHTDTTFDAKITRYDLPLLPATPDKVLVQTIAASTHVTTCPWHGIMARVGETTSTPMASPSPTPAPIAWVSADTSFVCPSCSHTRVTWARPQVRTEVFTSSPGDSLSYERVFHVGSYLSGDTSDAQSGLSVGVGDYVRVSINLRRAADNTIFATLDTALLWSGGFVSSTDLSDSGYGHATIPVPDSFYLTMDIARGDSTDGFELTHIESYDDPILDVLPPADTSGGGMKQVSGPTPISTPRTESVGLKVTVHPNPATSMTRICVEELPEGVPAIVTVVDQMGNVVSTLYEATPEAELGLCLTLDCSTLANGNYYAYVQTAIAAKAVNFQVRK